MIGITNVGRSKNDWLRLSAKYFGRYICFVNKNFKVDSRFGTMLLKIHRNAQTISLWQSLVTSSAVTPSAFPADVYVSLLPELTTHSFYYFQCTVSLLFYNVYIISNDKICFCYLSINGRFEFGKYVIIICALYIVTLWRVDALHTYIKVKYNIDFSGRNLNVE